MFTAKSAKNAKEDKRGNRDPLSGVPDSGQRNASRYPPRSSRAVSYMARTFSQGKPGSTSR